MRKEVARLIRNYNVREKKQLREFKHSHDSDRVRNLFYDTIGKLEFQAGIMTIQKSSVKVSLRDKKDILYNYLLVDKMISNLLSLQPGKLEIMLDRSMSKDSIAHFDWYVKSKVEWKKSPDSISPTVKVSHVDSTKEKCIQVADYVAGACFSKFERRLDSDYLKIKCKILYRDSWGNIDW